MPATAALIHNHHAPMAPVRELAALLGRRGWRAAVRTTTSFVEGGEAAREALRQGARVVVPCGGDGTVLSVLEPLLEADAAVCPLPLGTANDFATYLGVRSPADVAGAVTAGAERRLDHGRATFRDEHGVVSVRSFCSSAGMGVLARVARMEQLRAVALGKRMLGNAVWPLLFAASAVRDHAAPCRIQFDLRDGTHTEVERTVELFDIYKIPRPGGFNLAPDAAADSGVLHMWFFGAVGRARVLHNFVRVLRGHAEHLCDPDVDYVSLDPRQNRFGLKDVTAVAIEGPRPLPLQLDGEYMGTTPAAFTVVERALRVCAAAS